MIENPIVGQMLKAKSMDVEKIHRPLYFVPPMNNYEANSVNWTEFRTRILPLAILKFNESTLEYIVTPKSYSFGLKDVNIFVGGVDKNITTIKDMSTSEGNALFNLQGVLVDKLLERGNKNVHVTVGFNPEDLTLIGNHSLERFHSHIYVVDDKTLKENLSHMNWKDLNWFNRLSLIEPFSKISHDFIVSLARKKTIFSKENPLKIEENLGFTSIYFQNSSYFCNIFPTMAGLYTYMNLEYNEIQNVFTDKTIDPSTGRYIPRMKGDCTEKLKAYLNKQNYLSKDSINLLEYLANHLMVAASGREKGLIEKANQIWISKGFSGAFTFSFSGENPGFRLDVLPRVITTACSSKTLCGKDRHIIFDRNKTPATGKESSDIRSYWKTIQSIINVEFPINSTIVHQKK